jgi:hypothetical protein
MRGMLRSVAASIVVACVLVAGVSEAGAAKPITGKLNKRGYTVIAVADNGKARSVRPKRGSFRLKPTAKRVTLHLRAKDGTYAGPIVVGRKGKDVIVGVKAGAHLGTVLIKAGKGYAKVKGKLPDGSLDSKRIARAKKGVPIGAGNFGRVLSRNAKGPAADRDLDGIPAPLDIDDDGDKVIDNLDTTSGGARAAQGAGCGPNDIYCPVAFSALARDLENTLNVNAGSAIDGPDPAAGVQGGYLNIDVKPGGLAELDCGDPDTGLVYCRGHGSTGRAAASGPGPPFPGPPGGPLDADGDGFGTLDPALEPNACGNCAPNGFFLTHGARGGQIGSGDLLIERVTGGGTETQYPGTLGYVFATVPALKSFQDETMGAPQDISYPVAPGQPGTFGNGLQVDDGPDPGSDVEVTLTFWRPQRTAIPDSDPPGATAMDIGRLRYLVLAGLPAGCPQSTVSSSDPALTPVAPSPTFAGAGGFSDSSDDQVSSPANTLTFRVNLTQCLAANGSSFNSGEQRVFSFVAASAAGPDFAQQNVFFKHP